MAKPILYFVLYRPGYHRPFDILGVTSEKGRQVYGRDPASEAVTHISERDVIYRFPEGTTLEYAIAAGPRADAEAKRHEVGISQARAELSRLQDARDAAVLSAAKGWGERPKMRQCMSPTGCGCMRVGRRPDEREGCEHWQ